MKTHLGLLFGALLALNAMPVSAQSLPPGSFKIAQGASCQSWFSMCSARCKTRAPTDANCVSDHCSPKLATCRQTGCWQEGALYGGGKQCGLSK